MVAPLLTAAWAMTYWLLLTAIIWTGLAAGTWLTVHTDARYHPRRLPHPLLLGIGTLVGGWF